MKYLLPLMLFVASTLPCSIDANETLQPIPLAITHVQSQGWPQGGGMFRVIVKNTELEPCLTLESINLRNNHVVFSRSLCPEHLVIADFYNEGNDLQISTDYDGFYWEIVNFNKQTLDMNIELFLPTTPAINASCSVEFTAQNAMIKPCRLNH